MSDDSLRGVWQSNQSIDKETLTIAMNAVLDEDRASRDKDRSVRIAAVIVLTVLCPASLWFATYGRTPLVRGAYALMGAGIAITMFAEWMNLAWSRQALPGPADTRSQLRTTAFLLSRQATLYRTGSLWSAPIFLGVTLVGLWIYQERSHAEGYALWAITAIGWLFASAGGFAKGKKLDERRARVERMLVDWGE